MSVRCLAGLVASNALFVAGTAVAQAYTPQPYGQPYPQSPPPSDVRLDRARQECCELRPFSADGEVGMSFVDLRTLGVDAESTSAAVIPTRAVGPMAGIGLGAYYGQVGVGLRGRVASFDAPLSGADRWELWSANAELAVRVPLQRFVPRLSLGAGYTSVSGLTDEEGLLEELDIDGFKCALWRVWTYSSYLRFRSAQRSAAKS